MYIETKKGRVYCQCDKCGKPFSYKVGSLKATGNPYTKCRACLLKGRISEANT